VTSGIAGQVLLLVTHRSVESCQVLMHSTRGGCNASPVYVSAGVAGTGGLGSVQSLLKHPGALTWLQFTLFGDNRRVVRAVEARNTADAVEGLLVIAFGQRVFGHFFEH